MKFFFFCFCFVYGIVLVVGLGIWIDFGSGVVVSGRGVVERVEVVSVVFLMGNIGVILGFLVEVVVIGGVVFFGGGGGWRGCVGDCWCRGIGFVDFVSRWDCDCICWCYGWYFDSGGFSF